MLVSSDSREAYLRCFLCTTPMVRESATDTIEKDGSLRLDYRCPTCDQLLSYELMTVTITGYSLTPQQEEVDLIPLTHCTRCGVLYDNRGKHTCIEDGHT